MLGTVYAILDTLDVTPASFKKQFPRLAALVHMVSTVWVIDLNDSGVNVRSLSDFAGTTNVSVLGEAGDRTWLHGLCGKAEDWLEKPSAHVGSYHYLFNNCHMFTHKYQPAHAYDKEYHKNRTPDFALGVAVSYVGDIKSETTASTSASDCQCLHSLCES